MVLWGTEHTHRAYTGSEEGWVGLACERTPGAWMDGFPGSFEKSLKNLKKLQGKPQNAMVEDWGFGFRLILSSKQNFTIF